MTGYRPAAPIPDLLVRWPADWGVRFTLFVDTEEEFDWRAPLSAAARSITALAALPAAHRRLRAAGVPVTYLVDHPVATDPAGIDALGAALGAGGAAIGTQLHPWVNPPPGEHARGFPGFLPPALEAAKLDALTAAIEHAWGVRPRAYRAGRYGIGPNTAALLAARGYRLDSSMRARYDYRAAGGPDFSAIGPHAFHLAPGLVELPLTGVFTGRFRSLGPLLPRVGRWGRGALARTRAVQRVALTPEDMPLADAREAVRVAVGEGVQVLNFSFHSPSLAPGHTPYVRDAADLAAFWRWWDAILADLARAGVRPASLEQVIAAALPGG